MPYFFVVPAYVVFVVAMLGAAFVMRFIPQVQPLSGYVFGGTIGSVPAFLTANILVVIVGVTPAWIAHGTRFPEWLTAILKFFVPAVLFIGPFVASAVSVIVGFAAGVYIVFRRRRTYAV